MTTYLAIDIGASSGRHIVGMYEGDSIKTEEVYRFPNAIIKEEEGLVWDVKALFEEVKKGLRAAFEKGYSPEVIAIDTWGVDYCLLDKDGNELLPVFSYRDDRTKDVVVKVWEIVSKDELYARCGIQFQPFNTIYQLYCDKLSGKLDRAEHFLMIPDYLAYKLTGQIKNEYTNASTTNLLDAKKADWDEELIERLGLPGKIFSEVKMPSSEVGPLLAEVADEVGFDATVVLAPTHDTASAVCASPVGENDIYLSSGTWSLMGVESLYPMLDDEFKEANFTNEGGIDHRYRILKNIMGMWLIQNIKKEMEETHGPLTFDEMVEMARASDFTETINVNDERLVAPVSMIKALKECIGRDDISVGDIINCVYNSLAQEYKNTVIEIEKLTGREFESICIVGGGCRNDYLNQLTAKAAKKIVKAGPSEATACGNLLSQMMYKHPGMDLWKGRNIIKNSFEIKEFDKYGGIV